MTGIEIDPPLSLPMIVRVVPVVVVNDMFGTNLNLNPSATCAVVDETSPMNVGIVAEYRLVIYEHVSHMLILNYDRQVSHSLNQL